MSDESPPWHAPAPTLESWSGEISSTQPWFAFPIGMVKFNDDGTLTLDRQQFGTCFFISGGIFITAWHVVADSVRDSLPMHILLLYGAGETPGSVAFEPVKRVERVIDAEGRETDIAIGFIGELPPERKVPRVPLSSQLAAPGSYVASYGFARSQWHEEKGEGEELADLSMNMVPRFHRGTIEEHLPQGRGLSKSAVYVHDAETGGGISGGPLFDMTTKAVCGVNSTGMDDTPYSTAADIRAALDWPIPFAGNRTLRSFAAEDAISLR